jgi:hypothetical protein
MPLLACHAAGLPGPLFKQTPSRRAPAANYMTQSREHKTKCETAGGPGLQPFTARAPPRALAFIARSRARAWNASLSSPRTISCQ